MGGQPASAIQNAGHQLTFSSCNHGTTATVSNAIKGAPTASA